MKTIRKVMAVIICMTMLLGSVTVFADGMPEKNETGNPTWGDIWDLDRYADSILDGAEWVPEGNELIPEGATWPNGGWDYAMKHFEKGTIIVKEGLAQQRQEIGEKWYWDKAPGEAGPSTPLENDAKEQYTNYYNIVKQLIAGRETATGEYYLGDLMPKLDAVEKEISALRTKIDNGIELIADDAEAPKGVKWVRETDWTTFTTTVDNISDNDYPKEGQWYKVTRVQCEGLIKQYTNALNAVKALIYFTPLDPAATPEIPAENSNESASGASAADTAETVPAAAPVETYALTSSVGSIKSTVDGVFMARKMNGIAFTTPMADIGAGYGLATGEKAFVKVLDLDPRSSYLAQAVIDNAAAALGAEAGPALNIEIGKMDAAGRYSALSQEGSKITVMVGIPANFAQAGKTYAVICVRPGGAFSYLKDLDADPDTITFTTTGGLGAYAVVRY